MDKFKWDYSNYSDILHIHSKDQITKGSVELGDFTLDFGKNNEIVGIEVEHASEFFSNMDINRESLNEIQNAQLIIDKRNPQCQLIFLKLEFPNITKKIPLPTPFVA